MRRLFASLFSIALLGVSPAYAVMEDYPSVKLQGLDKSVGRTITYEAKVGSTIQYGPLFIKIHACRKAPPIEKPESASFLQIWEVPPGAEKSEWVFSGWMFASSPALSAMDHPVYDVWVLDCLGKEQPNEEAKAAETNEEADQTDLAPADENASPAAEPAPVEPVPTDSEAEPETQTPATNPEPENGAALESPTSPGAAYPDASAPIPLQPEGGPVYDPAAEPYPNPLPAPGMTDPAATADPYPQDPSRDGTTAYDFMRQQQGTSAVTP